MVFKLRKNFYCMVVLVLVCLVFGTMTARVWSQESAVYREITQD